MITLTREEAQQVLDALQCATPPTFSAKIVEDWQSAVEFLRARLSAPEPEPVAWVDWDEHGNSFLTVKDCGVPLYTAPPQREWQGLTDEEVYKLKIKGRDLEFVSMTGLRRFASDIETTLKGKNT